MNDKMELINTILYNMMAELNKEQLYKLKDQLQSILYSYSISKIKTTEVSTGSEETTEELLKYFAICKLGAGRSKATVKQYLLVARQLCSFVNNKSLNMITTDDVQYFLAVYKEKHHVSGCTMDSKRRYLSSIFGLLKKHKKIAENPMETVERIKYPCKIKEQFSEQEIRKLYEGVNDCKNDIIKCRNNAILSLCLDTGCRVSEITNISIEDCNFQSNEVKVEGKGSKERIVYFSKSTKDKIIDYLELRNIHDYNTDVPLFMDICNKNRLKSSGVRSMLKRIGLISGVSNVHPHRLRRTCATNLVVKGVQIDTIARYLGHANLDIVQKYVCNSNERMKRELQKVGLG